VFCVVDGIEDVRRAVRQQIRRGAKVIKVLASGGIFSRDDNPKYAQFSPEELRVIVAEAARQGRIVAAHVHGKAAIIAVSLKILVCDVLQRSRCGFIRSPYELASETHACIHPFRSSA
jgi:imidazolonepropionase-like amidohydrolase